MGNSLSQFSFRVWPPALELVLCILALGHLGDLHSKALCGLAFQRIKVHAASTLVPNPVQMAHKAHACLPCWQPWGKFPHCSGFRFPPWRDRTPSSTLPRGFNNRMVSYPVKRKIL